MYKSYRRHYQKRSRSFQPLVLLLALPLLLIFLEVLARIIVGVAGKSAELAAYQGEPPIVTAYRLKFINQSQQPYDALPNRGRLAATRRLSVGYQLAGNQQSKFWRINEQGFRAERRVPQAKPKDEIRIFILGGSTAFGLMSLNNQTTIANKLEASLNQRVAQQKAFPDNFRPDPLPVYKPEREKALTLPPAIGDGQYRVINAAVPGYASGNQHAQLALQILAYDPDVIVVLDGYADLMLASTENEIDIPHAEAFLSNAPAHLWASLTQQMNHWSAQSYLFKATQYWVFDSQPSVEQLSLLATESTVPLAQRLASDSAELGRRTGRYKNHQMQMARLTSQAEIPLILAIQPEITGRSTSKLSPNEEKLIRELGSTYTQRVKAGYAQLELLTQQLQEEFPDTVRVVNFYKLYENFPSQAFYDTVHLTDEANTVLAEGLYKAILELPQLQQPRPKPLESQK